MREARRGHVGGNFSTFTRIGNYENILRKNIEHMRNARAQVFDGKAINLETFARRQVPLKSSGTRSAVAL